jgi:hypothetical protein
VSPLTAKTTWREAPHTETLLPAHPTFFLILRVTAPHIFVTFYVQLSSYDVIGLYGIAIINYLGFLFLCEMILHPKSPAPALII